MGSASACTPPAPSAWELCLFGPAGQESRRLPAERLDDGLWCCHVPGCGPGQRYGYRVHGPWAPWRGLRCNPAKLLLDPHARILQGRMRWGDALYDFEPGCDDWRINTVDSAALMPRCVVADPADAPPPGPGIPWSEAVVYEANVRGYTMRAPGLSETERGRFRGLANGAILDHLRALGITTIELMPVHALLDEAFLAGSDRRNLWGYNPYHWFAPEGRLAEGDPRGEFLEMVRAIHEAGLEVLLDVVYNHTAETDTRGPCLSLRGLDNLAYYRTVPGEPGEYVNHTGCGNTINADHPRVQELVVDSLAFWHREMGVDGFRFDLATVLGRGEDGFEPGHPLLRRIAGEPALATARLIAEPWDPGPRGYQLGRFPAPFTELNDRFRDNARRFWRGEEGQLGELAARLHGSADLFDASGRGPGRQRELSSPTTTA